MTSTVEDALRLGCSGIGFTIYPGQLTPKDSTRSCVRSRGKRRRKGSSSSSGPTRVVSRSRRRVRRASMSSPMQHLAAQLGANIIKVKPPAAHLEQDAARRAYLESGRPIDALADRVRDVVQSCFNGRRIVIFSGGASKGTEAVFEDVGNRCWWWFWFHHGAQRLSGRRRGA